MLCEACICEPARNPLDDAESRPAEGAGDLFFSSPWEPSLLAAYPVFTLLNAGGAAARGCLPKPCTGFGGREGVVLLLLAACAGVPGSASFVGCFVVFFFYTLTRFFAGAS